MPLSRTAPLVAVFASLPLIGAAQNKPSVQVENAFRAIDESVATHDIKTFADALADSFTFVGINGALIDRKKALEMQTAGKLLAGTPNEILKTQVIGDTALVTYKTTVRIGSGTLVGTRVFVLQSGAWKWAYSHGSIVIPFTPK
jgi:hypothetical protein